ncbi:prepilin peptidase [Lactococcus carnosus]|uniref:prepilin peptidase n=1 Tax=Pseudolactococcus carnosus TaxID=2749961 RepID=UPI001FBA4150|nr:prepilin peptidase [Lactococcus carnosus]MCJ2002630.1 prepilin peptidase [Lactococcus carnosus]
MQTLIGSNDLGSFIFTYSYVFIFGACLGSFFMVVGLRLPQKENLITPSHCDNCQTRLNSVEVQDAIKVLKEKQILTNQVVKVLQETFDKSESVLWNYELKVMSDSGANAAVARTFDNKELVSLTLNGAANYYGKDGVKKVITDLEAIPWIYSAMLETMENPQIMRKSLENTSRLI